MDTPGLSWRLTTGTTRRWPPATHSGTTSSPKPANLLRDALARSQNTPEGYFLASASKDGEGQALWDRSHTSAAPAGSGRRLAARSCTCAVHGGAGQGRKQWRGYQGARSCPRRDQRPSCAAHAGKPMLRHGENGDCELGLRLRLGTLGSTKRDACLLCWRGVHLVLHRAPPMHAVQVAPACGWWVFTCPHSGARALVSCSRPTHVNAWPSSLSQLQGTGRLKGTR